MYFKIKDISLLALGLLLSMTIYGQSVAVGDKAPEIVASQPNGESFKLSSLQGQSVLLVFWSSKCSRCKAYVPQVADFYKQHQNLDNKEVKNSFTIMGLSVDSEKDSWVQAIHDYDLIYPHHASDLKGWLSKAAEDYGIRSIPQTILIDEKGLVVAVNPTFENVSDYLNSKSEK